MEIGTGMIAQAISKAGWRSLIVCAQPNKTLQKPGVDYIDLPLRTKNPFQMIKNIFLLKKLIARENVDIVHARSRGPAWSAYYATRSLNIPFVTTYHAAYNSRSQLKTWYNSVMARGDRVIAISHFIEKHILSKYKRCSWFDPKKLRLVERGIDLTVYDPQTVSQERMERTQKLWGIEANKRLLLLPGRITRGKGHKTLIEALSLLKDKDVDLIIVGSDHKHEDYRESLLAYADSLGLGKRVKWMPPAPDLSAAYKLADIIVCPSRVPEGFGRVVAEAQAMEKPIIVSAHGAAPEVMEEGVTGWTFPPEKAQALAQVLEKALGLSSKALAEIGKKGRKRVQEKYDEHLMEAKTIAVYKELLRG
jgi:glycosyltransferase involved in cell wall biosynthesis